MILRVIYGLIYLFLTDESVFPFCFLSGLMCELLWSDPQPTPGRGPSKRGVGLCFGVDVTKRFLQENNLGMFSLVSAFFLVSSQ